MKQTPREMLTTLIRNDPKASDKELLELCRQEFERDGEMRASLYEYWFTNTRRTITLVETPEGSYIKPRRNNQPDPETRKARAVAVASIKSRIAEAVLMDVVLSNGVALRNATGAMVAKESGWLADIAKVLKPGQVVGKHLTEIDLRNLRMRNSR